MDIFFMKLAVISFALGGSSFCVGAAIWIIQEIFK